MAIRGTALAPNMTASHVVLPVSANTQKATPNAVRSEPIVDSSCPNHTM